MVFLKIVTVIVNFSSVTFTIVTSFEALNEFKIIKKNPLHWQRRNAFSNMQNTYAYPLCEIALTRFYWKPAVPQ